MEQSASLPGFDGRCDTNSLIGKLQDLTIDLTGCWCYVPASISKKTPMITGDGAEHESCKLAEDAQIS